MKIPVIISLFAAMLLPACSSVTHRKIVPRPAPTVDPVRQYIAKSLAHAQEASHSAVKAEAGIEAAKAIAAQLEADKVIAQTDPIQKLKTALVEARQDIASAKDQADASAMESQAAKAEADTLQKRINVQTDDLNEARQTVADQQDEITSIQKHDAATALSNRKLIFKIMIYRVVASVFAAWIASKFVPILLPQFKLYAVLGAGVVTLGFLCWLL